jgi:hypothetical protein
MDLKRNKNPRHHHSEQPSSGVRKMLSKMKINHVSSAGGSDSTGEREGGKEKGTERERERE